MRRYLRHIALLLLILATKSTAQTAIPEGDGWWEPQLHAMSYDDFNDRAASVGRIVRDSHGMMWFGTQDGLYRFDGYEFQNFKSRAGDGTDMGSSRIGGLYSSSEGSLWCLIEDRVFLFDLHTYRYIDVLAQLEQAQQRRYKVDRLRPLSCSVTWVFTTDGTIIAIDDKRPATSAHIVATDEDLNDLDADCDSKSRSWILTNKSTYVYADGQLNRLNRVFSRVVSCGEHVWLLTSDGQLARYDERKKDAVAASLTVPYPVKGMIRLSANRLALTTQGGVWLLSSDGTQLRPTEVTWPIQKLIEDSNGRLWFLGTDNHLCSTDREGRNLQHIAGVEMSDFNIHVDRYGTQWFFSKNGDTFYASQQPTVLRRYMNERQLANITNTINDGQGGCWFISDKRAYRMTFYMPPYQRLDLKAGSQGRGMGLDSFGRLLIGTRYDKTVTLTDNDGTVMGYLTPDGHVYHAMGGRAAAPPAFGASVYRVFHDCQGTLWMGTKSDGMYRLKPLPDGNFSVNHYTTQNSRLPDNEIYDFAEDSYGRLWIATHRGGLACAMPSASGKPNSEPELVIVSQSNGLDGWQQDFPIGINTLFVTPQGILLVGSSNGLFVADINNTDLAAIRFARHVREADRTGSLSSNGVMHIVQTTDGRVFISTEGGGINEITTADLKAPQLDFRHYDGSTGFPNDVVGKMAEYEGSLWVTTPDRLIEIGANVNSFLVKEHLHFATSVPVDLGNGKWVFGTDDGAVMINLRDLKHSSFVPPLVMTGVSIENKPMDFTVSASDTITLAPGERSLTLWFAALDFEDTEHVAYAYRMGSDDSPWTYLGQNRSIALTQLHTGTYKLTIRSTNSDGVWTDNEYTTTIIVKPSFWQTPWFVLLVLLTTLAIAAAIVYTLLYIRRIKRQQRETMEKYLTLVESNASIDSEANTSPAEGPCPEVQALKTEGTTVPVGTDTQTSVTEENATATEQSQPSSTPPHQVILDAMGEDAESSDDDDPFMQQFIAFVEANLGNSDVTIDDIASACAVSRTGLHRKVKHLLGTSPMEFLREARLRKANILLMRSRKNVSEIAYECGFSDPKYFSKCFKAATGKTPTEYKQDS